MPTQETMNLITAIEEHNLRGVLAAIEAGADINHVVEPMPACYTSHAMWLGPVGMFARALRQIVQSSRDETNLRGDDTILHLAVRRLQENHNDDSFKIVLALVMKGANLNRRNYFWEKPFDLIPTSFGSQNTAKACLSDPDGARTFLSTLTEFLRTDLGQRIAQLGVEILAPRPRNV